MVNKDVINLGYLSGLLEGSDRRSEELGRPMLTKEAREKVVKAVARLKRRLNR